MRAILRNALLALLLVAPISAYAQDPGLPPPPVGAGKNNGGFAIGKGGVQPVSPIEGADRTKVDAANQALERLRSKGPRVLSEAEIEALLTDRATPSGTLSGKAAGGIPAGAVSAQKPQDLGNFENAVRKVNDWVAAGEDVTLEKIIEINRTLLTGSHDDWAGVLRSISKIEVFISDTWHEFAKPATVDQHLSDFLDWYKATGDMNPIERAAEAYQQLLRIHPFRDANGRTTRLVMDFILQRGGFLPAVFDDQAQAHVITKPTTDVVLNVGQAVERADARLVSKGITPVAKPEAPVKTPAELANERGFERVTGVNTVLGDLVDDRAHEVERAADGR